MTQKVYFKDRNVLSSAIPSGIKDRITLTPDIKFVNILGYVKLASLATGPYGMITFRVHYFMRRGGGSERGSAIILLKIAAHLFY